MANLNVTEEIIIDLVCCMQLVCPNSSNTIDLKYRPKNGHLFMDLCACDVVNMNTKFTGIN